jgi:anti-sigma regulatory factor (Ser/Thr protein kinase)
VDLGSLELRLPAEPNSLALMRRALERWLAAVGANDEVSYDIKVACGEACMNCVEHAYPPGDGDFVVHATNVDGEVDIEVRDFGFWRPPRPNSDRGRGLELMRRLMDTMRVVPGPEGTTVHLRRRVRSEAFA